MPDRTIHIATVHWHTEQWIDLQISMFRKYISANYQTYAYFTGVSPEYEKRFNNVLDGGDPDHAGKLNALTARMLQNAADEDWLMFIDGDAFPIQDLVKVITPLLARYPLVAIQRLENLGEKHAHPSFCVTTAGFWRQIQGNWSRGYCWINALGFEETDVGGELLRILTQRDIEWYPLYRSNGRNILPVWYGIYGDLIYHHGAGFRDRGCRRVWYEAGLFDIFRRWDARLLNNLVPAKYLTRVRDSALHPEGRLKRKIRRELDAIDEDMKKQLLKEPEAFIKSLRRDATSTSGETE